MESIDSFPEWKDVHKTGISLEEYDKFAKEKTIEIMKKKLELNKDELTQEEIEEIEEGIKQAELELAKM